MNRYVIEVTEEYLDWLGSQPIKTRFQVDKRVLLIKENGHFGDFKAVGSDVYELRWENGRRVYYGIIPPKNLILLLGGNKNGQSKDIRQAQKIFSECQEDSCSP